MENGKRRTFSREFKLDAIRLVKELGYSVKRASEAVGIHQNCLRKWLKEQEEHACKAFPGQGKPIEAELHQLRAEAKRLREERDILKKAIAFFARHEK